MFRPRGTEFLYNARSLKRTDESFNRRRNKHLSVDITAPDLSTLPPSTNTHLFTPTLLHSRTLHLARFARSVPNPNPCGYCDKASYRSPCRKNVPASPIYEFLVAQRFRSPALWFENRLALGEVFSDDAGCLQPDGGVVGIRSGREHLDGSRQQRDRIWVPGVIPITEPVSCVFSILPVKSSNRTRKANIILLS